MSDTIDNIALRYKLEAFIKKYGTTNRHIANNIQVSESVICKFRKGSRNLSINNLRKLEEYLENA
jgi:plasmid maintenance system antidote protein VapI